MKASALFHSCMLVLLLSGIVTSAFSLVGAYFGTGDFLDNLFADRGSEQIGMGIKGLQLFHYLIGGRAWISSGDRGPALLQFLSDEVYQQVMWVYIQ